MFKKMLMYVAITTFIVALSGCGGATPNPHSKRIHDYEQKYLVPYGVEKISDLKNAPLETQLKVVSNYGPAIELIPNPSKKLQLTAVKQDKSAVLFIKNPIEELQLIAIKKYGGMKICSFQNPTEKVQLAAVKRDGLAIQCIENPNEKVQLVAVNEIGRAVYFIKNSTKKVQLAAVRRDGLAIRYINNPSEKVQLAAVQQNPIAIEYIKNPSENIQLVAVQQNPSAIKYIKNPTLKVKLLAYGKVLIPTPKLHYVLSDKSIVLEYKDNRLTLTNKTSKFLKVLSLAEYRGNDIRNIPSFSVPPEGVKTILVPDTVKITSLNNKILFGYAIEYKVGNGKTMSLYKTHKYSIEELK